MFSTENGEGLRLSRMGLVFFMSCHKLACLMSRFAFGTYLLEDEVAMPWIRLGD